MSDTSIPLVCVLVCVRVCLQLWKALVAGNTTKAIRYLDDSNPKKLDLPEIGMIRINVMPDQRDPVF